MDVIKTQQIINTMDDILSVIKTGHNRLRFLKDCKENNEFLGSERLVKKYTHRIEICEMAIVRLEHRLKRQAERIHSIRNL